MNMKLLAVLTPLSIYHRCSTWRTFWEEIFTPGEFTPANMENYLPVFPSIATATIFHVCRCELTRCEIFLPESPPSRTMMINRQWC